MLRLGLTGGIGSGKSTVASRLAEQGAVLVDADQLARAVVAAGTPGLAEVVEAFGNGVLARSGELDRAALGRIVFADDQARRRLEAITHPRIAEATAAAVAAAPPGSVVVHDVPLLVEKRMGPAYHLVLVVHADVEERVRRLVALRGMPEDDARARIAAQADDEQRRAAADVWLDNTGERGQVLTAVDRLWRTRLRPFAENLRRGQRATAPRHVTVVDPDPTWPAQAARLIERVRDAVGERALAVDHVGSTAVPGLAAKDVIDLQLVVATLADADAVRDPLARKGFARLAGDWWDEPLDGTRPRKRLHVACDPGRAVNLHIRTASSPAVAEQLVFRDWLRAYPDQAHAYAAVKRAATLAEGRPAGIEAYNDAKGPWVRRALRLAVAWAAG